MNRLFEIGKIGTFIDSYAPKIEKRNGEDVSCLTVHCRIQPFDAKLATALDNGVGGDSNIRPTVFQLMGDANPRPNFTRHDFKLPTLPPQNLLVFATPDTEARVAWLQARITGCYVRTQKDVNALALCFKATFGPVSRDQLELVHSLFRKQTFITFEEGEPLLSVEAEDDDDAETVDGPEELGEHKAPMWEAEEEPVAAGPTPRRRKARA